jgi:type II secretory pathway pseudopilin PulG
MSLLTKKISEKGITVVEIVVAVGIVSMIAVVASTFQQNVFVYNRNVSGSLTTAQDARAIVRTITTELRSTAPSSNGAYPIVQAATSSITFFSDIDGNGTVEQIRYFASSTKLYRGVVVPTGSPLVYNSATEKLNLLSANLRNTASTSIFSYFAGTYNGTASTSELAQPVSITAVRLVKISLILDVDQNSLPISRTYTTQVTLRNLKDNL